MANKSRKRKLDSEETMIDWERDFLMTDELHNEMKTMWEVITIRFFIKSVLIMNLLVVVVVKIRREILQYLLFNHVVLFIRHIFFAK